MAWEPGAFQFLLNLGFYAYLKLNKKYRMFKVFIYLLSLVFTRSTAGLIVVIFVIIKLVSSNKRFLFVILFLLIALFENILQEINYQLTYKLYGSYAFELRWQPIVEGFTEARKHIFGIGNSGYDIYYKTRTQPPWESFGQIFLRYGYPLFILINLLIRFLFNRQTWVIYFIFTVTFWSENIWFFPLVTPFYFFDSNSTLFSTKEKYFWCRWQSKMINRDFRNE